MPFIEVSRRDASLCWKKDYAWPDSYARFIQYVWSRYQANNTVFSPIHLDIISESVLPADYLAAIRMVFGIKHLRTFGLSVGKRYQELVPDADLVSPNKTHELKSYEGWAYCARTPDQETFLAYFEKGCPRSQIRGALRDTPYRAEWFDPRSGMRSQAGTGTIRSSRIGILTVPEFPSDLDWGLRLIALTQ